jgi:hypothetical protein
MGANKKQISNHQVEDNISISLSQDNGEWAHVQVNSPPVNNTSEESSSQQTQTSSNPNRVLGNNCALEWTLPLESLVFDSGANEIPTSFLRVFPVILRKFGGPPVEALGKAISYLQALFTESPAFHPYVARLPLNSLPTHDITGRQAAAILERRLIRIVQHLCAFFYGNIDLVQQYINTCRPELIPAPLFILVADAPKSSLPASDRLANGVHGYNNGVEGGEKLWRSPRQTGWQLELGQQILQANIAKCAMEIQRRQTPIVIQPPNLPPATTVPDALAQAPARTTNSLPLAPQLSKQQPTPPIPPMGLPMWQAYQGQQVPLQQNGGLPVNNSRPPQIFHVAPRMQYPVVPQLTSAPTHPHARLPPLPAHPSNTSRPSTSIRPASANGSAHPLKDDIIRLEAQLARLVDLVNRESNTRQ